MSLEDLAQRTLEFDDVPATRDPRPTDSAPVASAPTYAPGEVNPAMLPQIQAEQALAAKLGIKMQESEQVYVNATTMLVSGVDRLEKYSKEFDAMATVADAADKHRAIIAAENRKDYARDLASLKLDDNGRLVSRANPQGSLILPDHAFGQLIASAPDNLSARGRQNVNAWIGNSRAKRVIGTRYPNKAENTREAYRIVTESYVDYSTDRIAEEIKRALIGTGAKMAVDYDPTSTKTEFRAILNAPFEASEAGVGRVFRQQLRVGSGDAGNAAVDASLDAIRVACWNCSVIASNAAKFRAVHKGRSLREGLADLLARSAEVMTEFGALWAESHTRRIHDKYDGTQLSAEEVFKRLISHGYVKVPGTSDADMLAMLVTAWEIEPGDTAGAVNNALTRAAHTNTWSSRWGQTELETQAGELLYQRVYQLAPITDDQRQAF